MICKPKGIETHGIYHLLTYAAYVKPTGCKPKYKENMEAVVVACKEVALK
jgi:hypothetical protein